MIFHTWMATVIYWIGMACLLTLPMRSDHWVAWMGVAFLVAQLGALEITVGLHRLFSHRCFKVSNFWHKTFLLATIPIGFGSSIQWAAMHYLHHKHSDTNLDPHKNGGHLRSLIHRKYEMPAGQNRLPAPAARLVGDEWHMFVHSYYVPLWIGFTLACLAVFPEFTMNGLLPGLGFLHFMSGMHEYATHKKNRQGSRDIPWLEFILPFAGEWYHKYHHIRPGEKRFGKFDIGAKFINLIEQRSSL